MTTDSSKQNNNSGPLLEGVASAIIGADKAGQSCVELTQRALHRYANGSAGKRLTIGIDGRVLNFEPSLERGIGHYVINHLKSIFTIAAQWNFVFFLDAQEKTEALDELLAFPNVSFCTYDAPRSVDLFHIPDLMSMIPGFDSAIRLAPKVPTTVLFYDLVPLVFRENYLSLYSTLEQLAYLTRLRNLKESNAQILAISEFTKSDLIKHVGIEPERIIPIMAGLPDQGSQDAPTPEFTAATLKKFGLNAPFFMTVGALDPHKNFPAVANAFFAAHETLKVHRSTQIQLAVVGSELDPFKAIYRDSCVAQKMHDVKFTGYVTRAELTCLYKESRGLLFLSKYEGFGFPLLEAMANGCPVVASDVCSLPEVAGDAALLVDPADKDKVARSIIALTSDEALRSEMIRRGFIRAKYFTWNRTAEKTLQVWRNMLGDPSQQSAGTGMAAIATLML